MELRISGYMFRVAGGLDPHTRNVELEIRNILWGMFHNEPS